MTLAPEYFDQEYYEGGKGYHSYTDDARFQQWADDVMERYSPKDVLDFGCAKGYLVKALRDRGVNAYGFDVSEWAISQSDKPIRPYLSNVVLPRVDLVISYDTWEHIPESELESWKAKLQSRSNKFFFTVGTLQTPNWQHDASHITMKELDWWKEWWPGADWVESK